MSIFKKASDEYEEEELQRPVSRRRIPPKEEEYLPLRRKKKVPLKPWGKRERYLVLLVLVITVLTSAVLALSAREWKLPNFPRLHLPSLSLFTGETIIIEKDKSVVNEKLLTNSQKIIGEFKEETKSLSGVYGLYVIDLESDFSFGIAEDEIFKAASLIKLPVIVRMYKEEEAGALDLEEKYTLKSSDKVSGAGGLYTKPAGFILTYSDLLKLMGKQSDNTAFNICRNYLGEGKIKEIASDIGMLKTDPVGNETTPKDIGTFFAKLYRNEILNEKHKEELLDSLTDTLYEQWLAVGLPDEIKIAHKYGRETHVVNDAGIVFSPKPYIVVILSKGVVEREADAVFPKLSEIVYSNLTAE